MRTIKGEVLTLSIEDCTMDLSLIKYDMRTVTELILTGDVITGVLTPNPNLKKITIKANRRSGSIDLNKFPGLIEVTICNMHSVGTNIVLPRCSLFNVSTINNSIWSLILPIVTDFQCKDATIDKISIDNMVLRSFKFAGKMEGDIILSSATGIEIIVIVGIFHSVTLPRMMSGLKQLDIRSAAVGIDLMTY